MSNKTKGNYYKYKTKKYFEDLGYTVEYLETYTLFRKNGKIHYMNKDILYSDLLAYNDKDILLIQVKYNKEHIAGAKKNYQNLKIPCVQKIIAVWLPKQEQPKILLIK